MGRTNVATVPHYMEVLGMLWATPWFNHPEPQDPTEKLIWSHRVAILDAALYVHV